MKTAGRRKITHGFVIQTFDDNGKCIDQEFEAGEVDWEDDNEPLDEADDDRTECEYQPFHMVQPQAMSVALVGNLTDGYGAVGPFTNSTEACRWADGLAATVLTMQNPYEEFDDATDTRQKFSGGPTEWKKFSQEELKNE